MDFVKCLAYKTLMKQSFVTQLGMVSVAHFLLILGSAFVFRAEIEDKIKGSGPISISFNLGGNGIAAPVMPKIVQPQKVSTSKTAIKTTATPVVATEAKGAGQGEHREGQVGSANGTGSGPLIEGSATGREANIRDLYKAELRTKIDSNKNYPMMSRRLGQTGTVVVAFTMLKDGSITNVRIEDPAPFAPLNTSALEAVNKIRKFKPIPTELNQERMDLQIPIKFLTI